MRPAWTLGWAQPRCIAGCAVPAGRVRPPWRTAPRDARPFPERQDQQAQLTTTGWTVAGAPLLSLRNGEAASPWPA
eukprot:127880-Alexandrium_andersonii.AAC.1